MSTKPNTPFQAWTVLSFSRMEENAEGEAELEAALTTELDPTTMEVEERILQMLACLKSDRDRVILLFLILRGNGYRFPYKDIAKALGVKTQWVKELRERTLKSLRSNNFR